MNGDIKRMVITGDSISADFTVNIFNDAATRDNHSHRFTHPGQEGGIELINTGIGGHTIEMISERFERDCVDYSPDIAVVNGGTNDLWGWSPPDPLYENAWVSILHMARRSNIRIMALGIAPATIFPNDIMQKRDRWNGILKELIREFENFIYVDADSYVGKHRYSGPVGNFWDINVDCDFDGVHFSRAGTVQIVRAILDSLP